MISQGIRSATVELSVPEVERLVRILLVISDSPVAELASTCLRFAGYSTETARTGREALALAGPTPPNLLVMDGGCLRDGLSGLSRELRARLGTDLPVLVLAEPEEVNAGTMAVTVGGDRYLAKPFSLDDLTAQVRALLRRAGAPGQRGHAVLRCAELEFDEDSLRVRRGGVEVTLTPRERRILRYLLLNVGRTVTRAEIIEHVWPYDHGGHRRVLDVHMCNLRRKINHAGRPLIHTVHSIGYLLRDPLSTE